MTEPRTDQHLQPDQVAAYVDGSLAGEVRPRVQAHLALCADCRGELVDVARIVGTLPGRRLVRRRVWIPAAAAAALALFLARPVETPSPTESGHRQTAVLTPGAPRAILPADTVRSARSLIWSSVAGADRYRLRLFDASGTVIWEAEIPDTLAALPDTVRLAVRRSYYWKVEAHTGFDRWAPSDLTEFVVRPEDRR